MAELEIVLGRPGTGKSYTICEKIKTLVQEMPFGPPIYWIVPDEIAYTTERMLMNHFETALRVEVITMRRLAERIMASSGSHGSPINTTGKRLLLASVYRESLIHLGPLRRENPSMAFFDSILSAFDEFSDHLVDIAQLEGAIESAVASMADWSKPEDYSTGHSLLSKLRDLCLLYIRYRRVLENGQFLDPAVYFSTASLCLDKFIPLKDATIFFDGYTDMSPQMLQFAILLAKSADFAEMSLAIDSAWLQDTGYQNWRTKKPYERYGTDGPRIHELMNSFYEQSSIFMPRTLLFLTDLIDACEQNQVETHTRYNQPYQRYDEQSDLYHIEQNLYGSMMVEQKHVSDGIRIATGANIRSEVSGIAQQITRYVVKSGVSYDEIAVVVPNVDAYKGPIEDAFSTYQIPYNLDAFPPLTEYPLAKFLLAALSVVREEFSTSSIIRLLKTDFCGLTEEESDWFETYIKAYEISTPYEWQRDKPWTFMNDMGGKRYVEQILVDDARAERYRRKIIQYLTPFYEAMSQSIATPNQISTAIWRLFSDVEAKQVIATWMVNEDGSQNPLDASLHEQAWQYLIALCDNLACVSPDVSMATSDLIHVLFADLERVSLSTIPTAINHVLVTDFSRAHGWTADIVFVAGLTDQELPRRFVQTGLLQDEERLAFGRLFGGVLGYTSRDLQLAQKDDIYHLFTRAQKSLILSYPLQSADGRESRPSMVLSRIQSIFAPESLTRLDWHENQLGSDFEGRDLEPVILTPEAALGVFVDGTRVALEENPSPIMRPILEWFCENEQREQILVHALRGFLHRHDTRLLGTELSKALYGYPLKMNVYQLEAFAACPYKHFIQYGLKINAQDFSVVSPAAKGTLMHDVLLVFVENQMKDMEKWQVLSDEDAVQSMESHFHQVMDSPKFSMWHREAIRISQADDVLRSLRLAAVILTRHARFGRFAPHSVELSFGLSEPGSLPSFDVELDDGVIVSLRGRIDRVDLFANDGEHVFRIVDYKSSQLDIDLTKVEYGLRLQLPVYAAAIEQNSEQLFGQKARAVGMLYMPILHKVELKNVPIDEPKALFEVQKHMRARGWMVEDKQIVQAMDSRLSEAIDSELFSRVYTKTQTVAKHAPALPCDEWNMLVQKAIDNVKTLAKRILAGNVQVSPYRIGLTETACQNCPFQALCQFDPNYDQHLYRRLEKVSRADIHDRWSTLRVEVSK